MCRRSYLRTSAPLALALLIAVLPAEANKNKDLVKQAEQAVQQNRFEDAEKLYCEAAENGKDKKIQAKCDEYRATNALAAGILEFYAGNYLAAESKLAPYPGRSDVRRALAHFYMGASKLTRYLLAGSPADEKQLFDSAVSEFLEARRVEGFSAPRGVISPRIITVFQEVKP